MPELPEVETVRLGLKPVLEGHRIALAEARRPDLRDPLPENFAERLTGRTVTRLWRRAKYLLADLDDGMVWLTHLGMSGTMVISPARPNDVGKHDHVLIVTDDGPAVTFRDPRRFGAMDLFPAAALADHPKLRGLGPEPLSDSFTPQALSVALAGKRGPIKTALLDQAVVAGLGNIYVCEALFRAGISPKRRAGTCTAKRAERLVAAIKAVLAEAIAAGGSSISDHRQANGDLGYFQHSFAVYGREGAPCPGCTCDVAATGGIARIVQGGRSTFYCAAKQR